MNKIMSKILQCSTVRHTVFGELSINASVANFFYFVCLHLRAVAYRGTWAPRLCSEGGTTPFAFYLQV